MFVVRSSSCQGKLVYERLVPEGINDLVDYNTGLGGKIFEAGDVGLVNGEFVGEERGDGTVYLALVGRTTINIHDL